MIAAMERMAQLSATPPRSPSPSPDGMALLAQQIAELRVAAPAVTPQAAEGGLTPAGEPQPVPWGRPWLKAADSMSLPKLQRKDGLQVFMEWRE